MTSNADLYETLAETERNIVLWEQRRADARAAIIASIKARLGEMTPYAFARAADINWGNFHRVLTQGEWNAVIISQVLTYLDGAPLPSEANHKPKKRPKRGK